MLLYDPYHKGEVVKVPRAAPPYYKMAATKKTIEETLGVKSAENGLLAFCSLTEVLQQLLM